MRLRRSMCALCCPEDFREEEIFRKERISGKQILQKDSFMELAFYIAGAVAVVSTALMLTRLHIVHALLYLIVSLLGVAVVFALLGATFVAALEIIVYAGAIMVLFVFVVMMLNLGAPEAEMERSWLAPGIWVGPVVLACILIMEVLYLARGSGASLGAGAVEPKQVGIALFGPYLIGVELASMLLLAGVVGAYHLGYRKVEKREIQHVADSHEGRTTASGDPVLAGTDRLARTA
jgi:NADH-quinone oxidoreductase subunit J